LSPSRRQYPAFAKAVVDEAATLSLNGQPDMARLILCDVVIASVDSKRWLPKSVSRAQAFQAPRWPLPALA
jgi:hypothetical protein